MSRLRQIGSKQEEIPVLPGPSEKKVQRQWETKVCPTAALGVLWIGVSLPLTEIEGSALSKVSCGEHWKWGEPISVQRHEAQPLLGPRRCFLDMAQRRCTAA